MQAQMTVFLTAGLRRLGVGVRVKEPEPKQIDFLGEVLGLDAGDQAEHMLMGRMLLLRDSPNPEIVPYFPKNEPALAERFPSVDAAFAEYRTRRAEQLALLHTMDDVVWNKPALHAEYERYDLGILVHHMAFHDYWHFYRMEELWLTRDEYLK
jgi:hypothetical protein